MNKPCSGLFQRNPASAEVVKTRRRDLQVDLGEHSYCVSGDVCLGEGIINSPGVDPGLRTGRQSKMPRLGKEREGSRRGCRVGDTRRESGDVMRRKLYL